MKLGDLRLPVLLFVLIIFLLASCDQLPSLPQATDSGQPAYPATEEGQPAAPQDAPPQDAEPAEPYPADTDETAGQTFSDIAASSGLANVEELTADTWQWIDFLDPSATLMTVDEPDRYSVSFMEDGTAILSADCNTVNGTWTAVEGNLAIQTGQLALDPCLPGSRSEQFLTMLTNARHFLVIDRMLSVILAGDGGVMTFKPEGGAESVMESTTPEPVEGAMPASTGEPATLTNRVWTFGSFTPPDGQTILPASEPAELNSVEFFPDGRVTIIAGCNLARGTFSATADGTLTISAVDLAPEPCPAGSQGEQFLQWLNQASRFTLDGDSLTLTTPAGDLALTGNSLLTFGDQLTRLLVYAAGIDRPPVEPQTLEDLLDISLEQLVYSAGDPVNEAFGEAPGAVVRVESPQGSMVQAAGLASIEDNIPMGINDRLQIGSNTKMFTGVLLAQLVEEGVLFLDDTLAQWLPQMAAIVPNGEAITLRQLATHTAGVRDYGDDIIGAGAGDQEALRSGYSPEELVRFGVESGPPDFAPGEPGQWQYSNTGYILLGMVLEAATGQSYADLLQQRIFDPLQMNDTTLQPGSPADGAIANGYFVYPFDINTTDWNASQGWAAGGIVSTAADMSRFARGLMSGALFQDPATRDLLTDFVTVSENAEVGNVGGTGYGLGLIEFAPDLWGHRGQTIGFTSIVAVDPEKDFVLIALTNSAEGAVGNEQKLMGHFLELAP